jgi:transcriptional regulator with XRE-family HTH domain
VAFTDDVGMRLRELRHQRGWSLAEVERRSDGRWNAAVVGAYERGDRTISVARLSDLTAFYDAAPADVLPGGRATEMEARLPALVIDLVALEQARGDWPGVRRYAAAIRAQRGDAGAQLTVRSEDVLALAASEHVDADELRRTLFAAGVARQVGGKGR